MSIYDSSGALIAINDNWKDTQQIEIEATGLAPTDDLESAIVATLPPGTYATALMGKNNSTAVGLNEVYDLDVQNSVIAAIGTRDNALTGDDVLISSFTPIGNQPQSFLLRALGPSLASSGVTAPLADPQLELYDGNGMLIATNDNWKDGQEAEIIDTGLPPTDDLESALIFTLNPGLFTTVVSGKNGVTGMTFAEVYTLPYSGGPMNPAPIPMPSISPVSAASTKKHGKAGTFDIDLPLTGTPGIECRVGSGGTFLQTIVFTFTEAVTSVSGTTTTTCGTVNSTTISGSTVTVELGHVNCDGSDITVTVSGVTGASGSVDASATMTLRTGDVNADGRVGTADLKEIRMNVGRGLVTEDDFRDDITVDGMVNHGDTTLEKSKL